MCNLVRIEQDDVVDECGDAGRMGMAFGDTEEMRSLIHNDDEDDEEEEEVMSKTEKVKARRQHLDENSLKITVARSIAVLLVVMLMLLVICGFLFTILESAKHMRTNWDVYQVGTQRFTKQVFVAFEQVFQHVPSSVKTKYDEVTNTFLRTIEDWFYGLLGEVVNNVSSLIFGMVLTMLYTLFW